MAFRARRTPLTLSYPTSFCLPDVHRYSLGSGSTHATIANPGDYLHLVYVGASNRWVVTSSRGVVFS